ncbi:MAG: tyrosine-type recombinase/integrase [bacterium]|nr:tyrosine-type recombinase/integrase [bacterium]
MRLINKPTSGPKSLIGYRNDYFQYLEVGKDASPRTIENYRRFLDLFFKWLRLEGSTGLTPQKLTTDHIYGYRLFLSRYANPRTNRPLKKSTRMFYLVALRSYLGFFAAKGITTLPVSAVELPKLKDADRYKNIKFLTLEQLRRLFAAPDTSTIQGVRDRAIVETLFSSGLRISELTSLNVRQVPEHFNKNGPTEITVSGKGGRVRPVYLSPRAMQWIKKYQAKRKDDDPALFIRHNNNRTTKTRRLTVRAIEGALELYSTKAGLPYRVTPHMLRHTFATDLLNRGVDSRTVQEFLGHANLATTQMYLHITNIKLKDVHSKFHGREV